MKSEEIEKYGEWNLWICLYQLSAFIKHSSEAINSLENENKISFSN